MNPRVLMFIVFTISIFASGVLITTLFNSAPTDKTVVVMFYSSLFLTLYGLIFWLFWFINRIKTGLAPNISLLKTILRLTLIADFLLITLLFLGSNKILNWPIAIILILVAMILGLFSKQFGRKVG